MSKEETVGLNQDTPQEALNVPDASDTQTEGGDSKGENVQASAPSGDHSTAAGDTGDTGASPAQPDSPSKESEFEDILGNGCLLKKVVVKGEGRRAMMGEKVKVEVTRSIPELDKTFPEETLEFILGEGDVYQALDLAAALMNIGEESVIIAGFKYMYGELGMEPDVPPCSNFKLEVKLCSSEIFDYKTLSFTERFEEAKKKKERGNWLFRRKDYDRAINSYTQASRIVEPSAGSFSDVSAERLQEVLEFRGVTMCNCATALCKLDAYEGAIKSANECLKILPTHAKAYVRLGMCYDKLGNFDEAIKSYKTALKYDADNAKWIHGELSRLTKANKQEKENQQQMYSKMFWGSKPPPVNGATPTKSDSNVSPSISDCQPPRNLNYIGSSPDLGSLPPPEEGRSVLTEKYMEFRSQGFDAMDALMMIQDMIADTVNTKTREALQKEFAEIFGSETTEFDIGELDPEEDVDIADLVKASAEYLQYRDGHKFEECHSGAKKKRSSKKGRTKALQVVKSHEDLSKKLQMAETNAELTETSKMAASSEDLTKALQTAASNEDLTKAPTMPASNEDLTKAPTMPASNEDLTKAPTMPASNEDLTKALQTAAGNEDRTKALQTAAGNEDLTKALQTAASNEDLTKALQTAASNEDLTKALPTAASNEDLTKALPTAASNEDLTKALQTAASNEDLTKALQTAASNEDLTKALQTAASNEDLTKALPTAASHEDLTKALQTAASNEDLTKALQTAASNEDLTKALQTAASNEDLTKALQTAASNEDLTKALPTAASNEDLTKALPTAASNEDLTKALPTAASNDDLTKALQTAASNEDLTKALQTAASNQDHIKAPKMAASNENLTKAPKMASCNESLTKASKVTATKKDLGKTPQLNEKQASVSSSVKGKSRAHARLDSSKKKDAISLEKKDPVEGYKDDVTPFTEEEREKAENARMYHHHRAMQIIASTLDVSPEYFRAKAEAIMQLEYETRNADRIRQEELMKNLQLEAETAQQARARHQQEAQLLQEVYGDTPYNRSMEYDRLEGTSVDSGLFASVGVQDEGTNVDAAYQSAMEISNIESNDQSNAGTHENTGLSSVWKLGIVGAGLVSLAGIGLYRYLNH